MPTPSNPMSSNNPNNPPAPVTPATATPTANSPNQKLGPRDVLIGILSSLLYDLLKSGWPEALNKMTELCNAISQMGFVSLVSANYSAQKQPLPGEYDRWLNAILLVAVGFQAQAQELRAIADECETPYQDVARMAAERLIGTAGTDDNVEFAELKQIIRAYCLQRQLEITLAIPAAR